MKLHYILHRCAGFSRSLAIVFLALLAATRAQATGVPVGGFLPLVGIGLTDEFLADNDPNWDFFAHESPSPAGGTLLGAGGTPHYDLALLDTGAAVSLLTTASDAAFGIGESSGGGSDGFRGTEELTIGGASGFLQATIGDPLGLYAGGLQSRTPGSTLVMPNGALKGQTNTSMLTIPPESDLPNVLGLTYASQYATRIRNDQPQIFTLNGQTVRTPSIEFAPLASGGAGAGPGGANIVRRAPIQLNPGSSFTTPPFFFPNFSFEEINEDPSQPTIISGGMFLNVSASAPGEPGLSNAQFFFDTGADVTVMSEFTAFQLGFDAVADTPEFTVAIVGSGGTKLEVPGFFVDQFTLPALGGSIVLQHVPIIVLNVTNPADPGNFVAGIVGTNVLSGRNVVIDPDPSIGGGNLGPQLYISDSVTSNANWSTPAMAAPWSAGSNWSIGIVPDVLTIANLHNSAAQLRNVVVDANATAWEVNVSADSPTAKMRLRVANGTTLTTFAGLNIGANGIVELQGAVLDVQNIDIREGQLTGVGSIATGSGPIPGQVENVSGIVAPGNGVGILSIEGRYSNGAAGTLEIEIIGLAPSQFDVLAVEGAATLAGTLKVLLPGVIPFEPALGAEFSILTASDGVGGAFDVLQLPSLPSDRMWHVGYEETAVLLKVTLPGDFDGDGSVSGADLASWKTGFGTIYDGDDYLVWQRNLGSGGMAAAVPEPSTSLLVLLAACVGAAINRGRARSAAC